MRVRETIARFPADCFHGPRRLGGALLAAAGVLVSLGPGAAPVTAAELTLSVAISMKDAVEAIGRDFTASHGGVVLRYNVGASGALAQQIEAGAPVDVFVSAGARQMDALERRGRIVPGTRRAFAGNALVVVTPAETPRPVATPADLADARVRRIVIGDPRTVPVGEYAEESLRALGLWDRVQPKLVLAENVRQALQYVARGEVDAGIVYATDVAVRAGRVREGFRPPAATYRPIAYPIAVVEGTRQPDLARAFVDAVASPAGRAILARFGFLPPPAPR